MTDQKTPHVFEAVNDVLKELAVEGIAKTRTNLQQKYRFRGIDDVYNALSAAMARVRAGCCRPWWRPRFRPAA